MISNYVVKTVDKERLTNLQSQVSIRMQLFQKLSYEEFKIEDTGFESLRNSQALISISFQI